MLFSKKKICLIATLLMALVPFVASAQSNNNPDPRESTMDDETQGPKTPYNPHDVTVPPFYPDLGPAISPIPHTSGVFFVNPTTSDHILADVKMLDNMTLRIALDRALNIDTIVVADLKKGRGLHLPVGLNTQVLDVVVGKLKNGSDVGLCIITSDNQRYYTRLFVRGDYLIGSSWDGSGFIF